MRPIRLTLALVILLSLFARAAPAAEDHDRWFVIELGGERAGYAYESQRTTEAGEIESSMTLNISLQRLGNAMTISVGTIFVETTEGEPVSMSVLQDMGMMRVSELYVFEGDEVVQTTKQAGRKTTKRHPLPEGEWMTPAKLAAFVGEQLEAGAEEIKATTLDPTAGLTLVTSTYRIVGKENVEVMGKVVPAVKWSVEQSIMPGIVTTEYVDQDGETLRSDVSFGGITMTMLASDRELALADITAPELMASTLVEPSRPIESPRDTRRAEYILTLSEGGEIPDLVSSGAQRFSRENGEVRVTLDLDDIASAGREEAGDPRYLAATTNADSDDPVIQSLVDQALENVPIDDDPLRAEILRRFVHDFIDEKSLGVGFATASEVCRTRQGDCSEHGVLLAAMLRAAGVPSRVVSGLIYVDQFAGGQHIFGYHMWTQALLDVDGAPRWIDLDATLPGDQPYDAAHVSLSTSSLDDADVLNSMATLVGLLGTLQIEVVSAE